VVRVIAHVVALADWWGMVVERRWEGKSVRCVGEGDRERRRTDLCIQDLVLRRNDCLDAVPVCGRWKRPWGEPCQSGALRARSPRGPRALARTFLQHHNLPASKLYPARYFVNRHPDEVVETVRKEAEKSQRCGDVGRRKGAGGGGGGRGGAGEGVESTNTIGVKRTSYCQAARESTYRPQRSTRELRSALESSWSRVTATRCGCSCDRRWSPLLRTAGLGAHRVN
jgi:hypothetical protein